MTTRTYDPPAEPVTEDDCLHCNGTGLVDDDAEVPGIGLIAVTHPCDRCEQGRAPVDAEGVCACEDCLHLPADQRPRAVVL